MKTSDDRPSLAGITGAYKAVSTGRPGKAAFLMWKWASLVALLALFLYIAVRYLVSRW